MKENNFKTITLAAEDGVTQAVVVPERGAWISSLILPLKNGARETLFQHDHAWDAELKSLPGGSPFVFPICARIARGEKKNTYLYDGKQYELTIHGFSWREKWHVEHITKNSIEMVLRHNANTLQSYPFEFEVRLRYEVVPGKLICYQVYENQEKHRKMPYYAGFHPYFLTPHSCDEKEKVIVDFKSLRRLKYNDTLTDIVGEQPILKTPISIMQPEANEQLNILCHQDKSAKLIFPNGDVININVTENAHYFPYLQLYTIPEKPFFCVEHWMGFPNALNSVDGVRWLKAGESESAVYEISVDCDLLNTRAQ